MLLFPPGTSLPIQGVIVIANRSTVFNGLYGFPPNFEITDSDPQIADMLRDSSWSQGSLNLSNSADEVLLLDHQHQLIDAISWGSSKVFLDPPLGLIPEGSSYERYPASLDSDSASQWRAQIVPDPAQVDLTLLTP